MTDVTNRYQSHLKTIGLDATHLHANTDGTLLQAQRADTRMGNLVLGLPRIALVPSEARPVEIKLGEILGQGGMGQVMNASQVALDRDVAVKFVRPELRSPAATTELLREALITGRLEHPNIVPIYLLGQNDDGSPFFAMKKVEGVSWQTLLYRPEAASEGIHVGPDPLQFHLEVLRKVCSAVSYAHHRKILHRDLKPANVMLGRFGEVYVLDWGIAVSLVPQGVLPVARDAHGLVGTPAYMAPEMAMCTPEKLGECTDVYMLGAILHEICVRRPRHEGDSLVQVLASAFESAAVAYGPEVPVELAAIANRATAKEPAARFESAEALSLAVGDFLRHRHSAQLTQAAQRHLSQLVADMLVIGMSPAVRASRVQSTFAACRFGFEQALVEWPDNLPAATGLQQAFERMLEHELQNENVAAARGLYGQLAQKRPDLFERIEALEKKLADRAQRLQKLEQLEASSNLNLALRERTWLVALSGVLYSALALGAVYLEHQSSFRFGNLHAVLGIFLFTFLNYSGTAFLWFRSQVNEAQKKLLLANIAATAGGTGFWLIAWLGDLHFEYALAEYMLLTATNWAVMTLLYDRRGVVTTLSFLSVAILGVIWPQWVLVWFALGTSAGLFGLAWMWGRERVPPGSAKPARTLVDDDAPTLPGL